uniref:Uncharacterized protein n=1 Tax=Neogobius melanostomus TaxID=47308 RepID=A0A8C6WK09_9GOBI
RSLLLIHFSRLLRKNLLYKEHTALKELSENSDIIIRPADKGGAVVILSKEKYINEAHRQLNTRHYERLLNNPLPDMKRQFDLLIKEAHELEIINDNEFVFLTVEHPVLAAFYLLPKLHKEPRDNPPGRPIISGNGTEPASKFIDYFIKPLVRALPSFIEDTTDHMWLRKPIGTFKCMNCPHCNNVNQTKTFWMCIIMCFFNKLISSIAILRS